MPWGHFSLWVGSAHPSPDGEQKTKKFPEVLDKSSEV